MLLQYGAMYFIVNWVWSWFSSYMFSLGWQMVTTLGVGSFVRLV